MSDLKNRLKNKIRTGQNSAHTQLIEHTNVNVNVNKRKKFEDQYTRQTYYIENALLEKLNLTAGKEKGEKTRIVNEALKQYLNI